MARSDEWRVHRPLGTGDLYLDPFDLVRSLGARLAHERRRVAALARLVMQGHEGGAVLGERAQGGFGLLAHGQSVPLRLDDGEDVAARNLATRAGAELDDPARNRCCDRVLHLHRLEGDDRVRCLD